MNGLVFLIKFLLIVVALSWLNVSYANVSLNYPGWFSEDRNFPGIPSKDIGEYKEELKTWSVNCSNRLSCNVPILLDSSINTYINDALYIGFDSEVYIDVDGVDEGLKIISYRIDDQMRDILFLESLKKSIDHWKKNYIEPMGTSDGAVMSEAFQRAFKIYSVYRDYIGESDFDDEHNNPILNALFGVGNTSYGNIFASDGLLESYAEGAFVNAIQNFASNVSGKQAFLNSLKLSKTDLADLGTSFTIYALKDSGAIKGDTAVFLDNLSTAGFGMLNGSVGLMMAPAKIFYNTADYIATGLHEYSQGSHLVNYYYFMRTYPGLANEYLQADGSLKDWLSLKTDSDSICTNIAINDDNIANALCNHNYGGYIGANAATEDEIRTAYAIANLFLTVQFLDIDTLKQEIVARVKLEELKDHGFLLLNSYSTPNKYSFNLPARVKNDDAHGGAPTAISYTYNDVDVFSNYSGSVSSVSYISGTTLPGSFTFDLSQNANTKLNAKLKTIVTYSDGFQKNSEISLAYYPQIYNLELLDIPTSLDGKRTAVPRLQFAGRN